MNLIAAKSKAVLSNRIYLHADASLRVKLREELSYKIPSKIFGNPPDTKCTLRNCENDIVSIPIGRLDLIPKDYTVVDKRISIPTEFPEFKFTLRESQQEVYEAIEDCALINANASWGKTFTAIAISKKFSQKTLIIVHNLFLKDQWVEEIQKTLGITPGIISGGKINHDSPITIANIQTLRKYALALRKEFGLIIVDEVHKAPAKEFEHTLDTFKARYKIGLSATLRRRDHLHVVLPDYFGPVVYRPKKENQMEPEVLMVNTGITLNSNMMIPWATKINELVNNPAFLELVSDLSFSYSEAGYKVLTLSDRTEFLERLYDRHPDMSMLVIGTTKNRKELRDLMEKDKNLNICYGAISIFKEGVSWNFLSCLLIATAVNNDPMLEQLIGRVQRVYPNKLKPVIVDFIFKGGTGKRQAQARAAFYMRQGFSIKYVELN
jgi:hypothetical protein